MDKPQAVLLAASLLAGACSDGALNGSPLDLRVQADLGGPVFPGPDDLGTPDLCLAPNACGDCEPGCVDVSIGPPDGAFPFGGNAGTDSNIIWELNGNLQIDASGYLVYKQDGHATNPYYFFIVRGCHDESGRPLPTDWRTVSWEASVPPMASLGVQIASGNAPVRDGTWGELTLPVFDSPLDAWKSMLIPNLPQKADGYLDVEFVFHLPDRNTSPRLKHVDIVFKCGAQ